MVYMKIRYRHDRKLFSIGLLLYCPFFLHVVWPFLPKCLCHVFRFNCSYHVLLFTLRVSFQLLRFKLPHPTLLFLPAWEKGSHSFYTRGFRSTTSRYSSPSLSPAMCVRHTYQALKVIEC